MNLNTVSKHMNFRGRYHSGVLSGLASAQAATVGHFWLLNADTGSGLIAVRRILWTSPMPAAQSTAITRVTAERVGATGTPSGATGTAVAYDSADSLPSAVSIRTASTGLTLTAGGTICSGFVGQALDATPAGSRAQGTGEVIFTDDGDLNRAILIRPGNAVVIRQADNGDTDQRFAVDIEFEAFSLAS